MQDRKPGEFYKNLPDDKLVSCYGLLIKELKSRGIIRSRNLVGDLGEYLAIKYYSSTKGLPKLQSAPTGTKNIDAISINGDRYSIKSTTGSVTGVFYGLNDPGSNRKDEKKFEYVIIVMFDGEINVKRINELTWDEFQKYKRWHSRMKAWNLSISKDLLENTKTIYTNEK